MQNEPNGGIAYRFHARNLHLVMGPMAPGTPVRFRALIDGKPPPGDGHDLALMSIRGPKPVVVPKVRFEFSGPGAEGLRSSSADLYPVTKRPRLLLDQPARN